jgi:catechol 2,3-dioxygenase-like lactoylglutathione lyase family enzyme
MKRAWTIIGVRDVPASFRWYQSLFGQPATAPAHSYFGQLLDSDGAVLLCLHEWGAHEHPSLTNPDKGTPGNGLLLFFRVDDFETALTRGRALVFRLEEEPHRNPNTGTMEFALRDPDGYSVTVSELGPSERCDAVGDGADEPSADFVGAWRLVSFESRDGAGPPRFPFGEAVGQLLYDAHGNMSVIVMKPDRGRFASEDLLGGTDAELRAAFDGFVGYCGSYTVDSAKGTVTHHVRAAAYPNWVGVALLRFYRFVEKRLVLSTPPFSEGGRSVTTTLVWERVR